jgi:elongator complex protein 3
MAYILTHDGFYTSCEPDIKNIKLQELEIPNSDTLTFYNKGIYWIYHDELYMGLAYLIKAGEYDPDDCHLFIQEYASCDGINYFISFENNARTKLYGFIRLRFNTIINSPYMLSCLKGHALIRELHVYGQHTGVAAESHQQSTQQIFQQTQHRGLGKALLAKAEEIATHAGYKNITVISGVGVKEYYRRRGYSDYETYLTKSLSFKRL